MSRATVAAVTNQKGGVGKSTIAIHIAFALNQMGKSVCFVDMDTQGNASSVLSRDARINMRAGGAEKIFEGDKDLRGAPTPCGIDLLHGHSGLERIDLEVTSSAAAKLHQAVRSMDYDFIIFDTPPALGVRQLAPLLWAHHAVLPTKPSPMDIQGAASTIRVLKRLIESRQNADLKWKLVVNNFVSSSKQQSQLVEKIRAQFPDNFMHYPLGQRVALADCLAVGKPIWDFGGVPREAADAWRGLPSSLGLV